MPRNNWNPATGGEEYIPYSDTYDSRGYVISGSTTFRAAPSSSAVCFSLYAPFDGPVLYEAQISVTRCEYCKCKQDAKRVTCSQCGAPL